MGAGGPVSSDSAGPSTPVDTGDPDALLRDEMFVRSYECSGEAIFLTDPTGNIVAANPAACRMVGRTEAEICRLGRAGIMDTSDPRLPAALEERRRSGRF